MVEATQLEEASPETHPGCKQRIDQLEEVVGRYFCRTYRVHREAKVFDHRVTCLYHILRARSRVVVGPLYLLSSFARRPYHQAHPPSFHHSLAVPLAVPDKALEVQVVHNLLLAALRNRLYRLLDRQEVVHIHLFRLVEVHNLLFLYTASLFPSMNYRNIVCLMTGLQTDLGFAFHKFLVVVLA